MEHQFGKFFFHGLFPQVFKTPGLLEGKGKKVTKKGKEGKENAAGSDFLCEVLRRKENP